MSYSTTELQIGVVSGRGGGSGWEGLLILIFRYFLFSLFHNITATAITENQINKRKTENPVIQITLSP
jgi:hypothetical protein